MLVVCLSVRAELVKSSKNSEIKFGNKFSYSLDNNLRKTWQFEVKFQKIRK